jgi:Tol biopolymer transport system component
MRSVSWHASRSAGSAPRAARARRGRTQLVPERRRLAYLTSGDGESFLLHVADADGANERLLPGTYNHITPSWSPDGTRIAVVNDLGSVVRATLLDPDGKAEAIVIEGVLPTEPVAERSSPTAWQRRAP